MNYVFMVIVVSPAFLIAISFIWLYETIIARVWPYTILLERDFFKFSEKTEFRDDVAEWVRDNRMSVRLEYEGGDRTIVRFRTETQRLHFVMRWQ